jgi:hypothetical protein
VKQSFQIVKWGRIKPFLDKKYKFNTIDIETVDNELFILGYTFKGKHYIELDDFYTQLHNLLIASVQSNMDILTWSRYDNTHLIKLLLNQFDPVERKSILNRIGKVTPLCSYQYRDFKITLQNVIKDSMIFQIIGSDERSKTVTIYNLKNLYDTDLVTTATNYNLGYYSKLGEEYHIIDKTRFHTDSEYRRMVIEANRLDNVVLIDIAKNMLKTFKSIAGYYPKTIFTNGSLARSYLLAVKGADECKDLNFKIKFGMQKLFHELLEYSMKSYHGGKIESYVLGYTPNAKIIDITSAYPYAMSLLPKMTNKIVQSSDLEELKSYYYAFIKCKIWVHDMNLIHPISVENPINKSNISPWGYMEATITKIEYDYMISKGCKIEVIDYVAVVHEDTYPYRDLVQTLFDNRMKTKKSNVSLSQMYKTILNSLYGITYELTDMYEEDKAGNINWVGYRAGDLFNSVTASYITAFTRTYLSKVSHDIVLNGGKVLLNMTDSIIFKGSTNLDVFSEEKILGKFEPPTLIKDVYILGAGRYEYRDEIKNKYVIKNRGFSVSVKGKSFYSQFDLNTKFKIDHKTFVTSFKATTKKYSFEKMGYLIPDDYEINPFNLGGKRILKKSNVDINTDLIDTLPVYLDEFIYKKALN